MEQRAEIAISLYKQFYTFAQLLGVLLANPKIPVWPTRKFPKLEVWPVSRKFVPAKITNHRVELLQKRFLLMWHDGFQKWMAFIHRHTSTLNAIYLLFQCQSSSGFSGSVCKSIWHLFFCQYSKKFTYVSIECGTMFWTNFYASVRQVKACVVIMHICMSFLTKFKLCYIDEACW